MAHAAGTFCWMHLNTPDIQGAGLFYRTLLGWTPDHRDDGYTIFRTGDQDRAGGRQVPGGPMAQSWLLAVAVSDIHASLDKAQSLGATVVVPAREIDKDAWMAAFVDRGGAMLSLWQPREYSGMAETHLPGTFAWAELRTRDVPGAIAFYSELFSWSDTPGQGGYTLFKRGERAVGGVVASSTPTWVPYFSVANCDEAVRVAQDGGATLLVGATDVPGGGGRFADVRDPQEVLVGVLQPSRLPTSQTS